MYGEAYWKEIINFEALLRHEVIGPGDLELLSFVDTPAAALAELQKIPATSGEEKVPDFAHSNHCRSPIV